MILSVLIVNYNVCYFLEHCLLSVRAAVEQLKVSDAGWQTEVLVYDNASSDKSVTYLAPRFPEVVFEQSEINCGFSKANNLLLRKAKGKYILFLNPDTLVPENCFLKLIPFMEHDSQVGACGVRMIDGNGRYLPESKRGYPGPWNSMSKMTGLINLFPESPFFAGYYQGHLDPSVNANVEVLSGAFILVRGALAKKLGGFDERFFMYAEDIDLCYRIKMEGYRNVYFADTTIIHFKGESTVKDYEYTRRFYTAMILFVRKHFPGMMSHVYIGVLKLLIRIKKRSKSSVNYSGSVQGNNHVDPAEAKSNDKNPLIFFPEGDPVSVQEFRSMYGKAHNLSGMQSKAMDEVQLTKDRSIATVRLFCIGERFTISHLIDSFEHTSKFLKRVFHPKASAIIGSDSKETRGSVVMIR